MDYKKPLISIGMPVYNGEHFISQAINSLLKQDYDNFELIISDNNSRDKTQQICLEHMAKDKRIHYYKNEVNIGPLRNFNKLFELSRGQYFMWHAHDDYRESNYISLCLEYLKNNPNTILCCTDVLINEDGDTKESKENVNTIGISVNQKFRKLLWNKSCASIYGLIKSDALKKTKLFRNTIGSDNLLLAELSLIGEFYQIPKVLFRKNNINREKNIFHKIKRIFDITFLDKICFFPFTKLAIEYWKLVKDSQLKLKEKISAFIDIAICFIIKYKIFLLDPVITIYLNFSKICQKKKY